MKKQNIFAFIGLFICLFLGTNGLKAQENPVKWAFSVERISETEANLVFQASIDRKFHLYSVNVPKDGPLPTTFMFPKSKDFTLVGKIQEATKPEEHFDESFEMKIKSFERSATFKQKIKINTDKDFKVAGTMDYMTCSGTSCIPFSDIDFNFDVKGASKEALAAAEKQTTATETAPVEQKNESMETAVESDVEEFVAEPTVTIEASALPSPEKRQAEASLLMFILIALATGLAAVATPCVFPMIPMTVSFLVRPGEKHSAGIMKTLVFVLSIAFIYGAIGLIVALTKSAEFTSIISTHWIPNLIFVLLFLFFAFSFFGAYEIALPSSFATKLDAQADKGGYVGSFFMAAALAVVSFSCTGPFVATLLIEAAQGASMMKPLFGMVAFGLGLGLPFIVLAVFPSLTKKMPRSGGWLNAVKVVFAFLLLAFSMKYLYNATLDLGWDIFSRESYLAIWIVIWAMLGLYLIGAIKFSHDSDLPYMGVFRTFLAIAVFSFVVYLIPGLFGAPLKAVAAFIPDPTKQEFTIGSGTTAGQTASVNEAVAKMEICGTAKYADFLHLPHGLKGYFDYKEGLACAKEQGKPVLVDFKGHGCSACKVMDATVWADPEVLELLSQYIIIALYVDEQKELNENEWVVSTLDGKTKKTIGKINLDFEATKYKTNALPYYFIEDADGNALRAKGLGGNATKAEFIEYLKEGLAKFKK